MTLDEEVRRGNQAERILKDDMYLEAFTAVRDEIIAQWEQAPARDSEGRDRLWLMLKLLERLKGHLTGVMETGTLAKKQIADVQEQNRISRWVNGLT